MCEYRKSVFKFRFNDACIWFLVFADWCHHLILRPLNHNHNHNRICHAYFYHCSHIAWVSRSFIIRSARFSFCYFFSLFCFALLCFICCCCCYIQLHYFRLVLRWELSITCSATCSVWWRGHVIVIDFMLNMSIIAIRNFNRCKCKYIEMFKFYKFNLRKWLWGVCVCVCGFVAF